MKPHPLPDLSGISRILALDPGPTESAYVVLGGSILERFAKIENNLLIDILYGERWKRPPTACVIEKIASFGMPVGAEVFETVFWSGRFAQAFDPERVQRITRIDVKMHLCHTSRATDANIRQALLDKFGGKDAIRKGGALYGVHGDVWSALAVAVTWSEQNGLGWKPAKLGRVGA